MNWRGHQQSGFTIVELLIVIVVIGILAAIVIVAYNGIQTTGRNATRIAAAEQIFKLISGYKAVNGTYPPSMQTDNGLCLTKDNVCTDFSGTVVTDSNASLMNELGTIGTPPQSINNSSQSGAYGLYLDTFAVREFDGQSAPGLIMFWLEGSNQDCKLGNAAEYVSGDIDNPPQLFTRSTTGYTWTSSTRTDCWISV